MPYPYARYSQIAVSDFIFGGMENTQRDDADRPHAARRARAPRLLERSARLARARAPVVRRPADLPRLGARVAQRGLRDVHGGGLARGRPRLPTSICTTSIDFVAGAISDEDSHRYRRPIVCNVYRDPIEIFDRHLYQKGAAVLHMLRGELGDARFWRAIARYVKRQRATKRGDDRSRARDRSGDRAQPARLLRPMGLPRRLSEL